MPEPDCKPDHGSDVLNEIMEQKKHKLESEVFISSVLKQIYDNLSSKNISSIEELEIALYGVPERLTKEEAFEPSYPNGVGKGVVHEHAATIKKNAQFLIDSYKKADENRKIILQLENAFKEGRYEQVLEIVFRRDLAWQKLQRSDTQIEMEEKAEKEKSTTKEPLFVVKHSKSD